MSMDIEEIYLQRIHTCSLFNHLNYLKEGSEAYNLSPFRRNLGKSMTPLYMSWPSK